MANFVSGGFKDLSDSELPANGEPQQDITISAMITLPAGVFIWANAEPNGAVGSPDPC
ncbi:hypothetical protein KCP73_03910 [Salmonella enterica subsp. enterica]|nr:hypothetical protein KCP73_03910 [Salmonella enterica subsp. enterica]